MPSLLFCFLRRCDQIKVEALKPTERAQTESGHALPVRGAVPRTIDAATGMAVGRILRAWYGNLNVAADAIGEDRRDLWR
jgi:hypothetical protein